MSAPLIWLPGMMCDARLFGPQVAALGGTVFPAHALDTMQALAADVLRDAPDRFALAGLSMGGILAMEVLRQAPERVARLALLDTNPLAETDAVKARRAPQIAAVEAGGLAAVMREQMIPNYCVDGPARAGIEALCLDMALDLGPEAFVTQSRALRDRPDQSDTLRSLTVPTLVLCGREDRLCPVSRHTLMHDLVPGSTLVILDGVGHLPTLERPDRTTAALRTWLES